MGSAVLSIKHLPPIDDQFAQLVSARDKVILDVCLRLTLPLDPFPRVPESLKHGRDQMFRTALHTKLKPTIIPE